MKNVQQLEFLFDSEEPTPVNNEDISTDKTENKTDAKHDTKESVDSNSFSDSVDKSIDTVDSVSSDSNDKLDTDTSEENLEESEGDNKNSNELSVYKDLYNDLKDKGIFKHTELEEDKDLTIDELFEIQQQEYEAEVEERLNAFGDRLGEDGRNFIKYIQNGGTTNGYFEALKQIAVDVDGDIEDEKYQDRIITQKMEREGRDAEEIEERLEYLTEKGRKRDVAAKAQASLKKEIEKEKNDLIEIAKKEKEAMIQKKKDFRDHLESELKSIDDINGLKLSKKDKPAIVDFLTKDAYKANDGSTITEFQKRLYDVFNDTKKSVLLAKLLLDDFDLSSYAKTVETNSIKKVRSNLENRLGLVKKAKKESGLSFDWS